MPRMNTKDAVKQRSQAGGVMYEGDATKAAGDDLFGDDEQSIEQSTRPYEYTDNGLLIRRELSKDEWLSIPAEIRAVGGSTSRSLNIGDATVMGLVNGYIETYEEAAELFGVSSDSVETYASICRNIPQLTRVNSLTLKHYRYIAPLPDDEKAHWISYAASNNLSSGNLKALIDLVNPPALPAPESTEEIAAENNWSEGMPEGVTVELIGQYPPPLPDENEDVTDDEIGDFLAPEHRNRRVDIEKKAKQNRWAEIDLNDILAEERRLKWLRKKVAQAKVEAGKQARMKPKTK